MNRPKFIPLEQALAMRGAIKMAVGWYAGARGIKQTGDDNLAQVDLVFEEGGSQRLVALCVWRTPPTDEQEYLMCAAFEYTFSIKMPVVSILLSTLEQTGEAGTVAVRH